MPYLLVQAESRGLSAFFSLLMPNHARRFRARAGPFSSSTAPCEHVARRAQAECVIRPAHCIGALRGSAPFEGVAGDGAAAPGQGKTFPFLKTACLETCGSSRIARIVSGACENSLLHNL